MTKSFYGKLLVAVAATIIVFAVGASAQTNFWWTNATSQTWSGANVWTNESGATAPLTGGSNDYTITFLNTAIITSTLDLGNPNFILNRLNFNGTSLTLQGSNLVFQSTTGGVAPSLWQNGTGAITINNNIGLTNRLTVAGSGTGGITLGGVISGTGGLVMAATNAILSLNGANTYTGGTIISNGIIRINNNSTALGSTTDTSNIIVIVNGGALELGSTSADNAFNLGNRTVYVSGTGVNNSGAIYNNTRSQYNTFQRIVLTGDTTFGGSQRFDVRTSSYGGLLDLGGYTLTKIGAGYFGVVNSLVTDGNIIMNGGYFRPEGSTIITGTTGRITFNPGTYLSIYNMTAANQITRPITINNATITFENNNATRLDAPITLVSNLFVNGGGSAGTIYGNIVESNGSYTVTKSGGYFVSLAGTNNWTGGTIINAGPLFFINSYSVPTSGVITINTGGSLGVTGAYSTVAAWLASGRIATNSTGAIALVANSSENVNMGVYTNLSLGGAQNFTVTYTGTLSPVIPGLYLAGGGGGTIIFPNANAFTGANRLIVGMGGGGNVYITGNNDYTGGTFVTNGTLRIGNNTTTGSLGSGPLTNNATVQFYRSNAMTISNLYGTGIYRQISGSGQVTIAGTNSFYQVEIGSANANNPFVFSVGSVSIITNIAIANNNVGTSGKMIVENGALLRVLGNLFLGETNSRPGEVVQNGGTVTIGGQLRVGHWPTETSTYTINGGSLTLTATSATNPFGSGEQNGTLYVGIDGSGIFNHNGGTVSAEGLVLDNRGDTAGTDTYNLFGGTLILGKWGIQGNASSVFNAGGGTLSASTNWSTTYSLNLTNVGGNLTVAPQTATTITLNGALTGTGGLNTAGNGTIILNGTNTYAGDTTINGSLVQFNHINAIAGSGRNVTVGSGGAVTFNFTDVQNMLTTRVANVSAGTIALRDIQSTETIDFSAANLSNAFLGAVGFVDFSAGTFIPYANHYRLGGGGGTLFFMGNIVEGDELTIGGGGPLSVVWLFQANSNTGVVNVLNNILRANDGLGLSPYANLRLNGGVFETDDGSFTRALGSGAGEVQVLAGGFSAVDNPLTVNLGGSGGTVTWGSADFQPSALILNEITANTSLTFTNKLDLNSATRTISVRSTNAAAPAIIAGDILGTGSLVKDGVGRLIFNAKPTFNGGLTINNGTVTLNAGANTLPTTMTVTISNSPTAVLDLNNNNQQLAALTGGGLVQLGSAMLTLGTAGNSTYGGTIAGSGGIIKVGSGTVQLTGASLYSGPTIISNGTLQLTTATVAGPVLPGLFEGRLSGAFNTTDPNPNTTAQLTTRYANIKDSSPAYPATGGAWVDNSTYVYSGYVYNYALTNVTWTFGENFDDSVLLKIDGVTILNNGTWNVPTTNNYTLTPGAHSIEIRFGQGGGGVGPVVSSWWTNGLLGFGYDPQGRGTNVMAYYQTMADPGNGLLFTTSLNLLPAASALTIASNAVLDLNGGAQLVGPLTGPVGALITNTAATPAWFSIGLPTGSNATYNGLIADSGAVSNAISLYICGNGIQSLTATNTYTGGTYLIGGTLRALYGVGVPTTGNLVINGGVFEPGVAIFTNALGTGGGQVQFGGGGGGFSAYNVPLTVNIGGAGQTLIVGSNYFNPGTLVLNGVTANTNLYFVNKIDTRGTIFSVDVEVGTAYLQNGLSNSTGNAALRKLGDGTLVISNQGGAMVFNSNNGFYISRGTLVMADGTITTGTSYNSPDYIGYSNGDSGTLTLQGNSRFLRYTNNLYLGYSSDSRGVLVLQDNTIYQNLGQTYVGHYGTGVVFMSGGTITNTSVFVMGNYTNSVGAFYQTGGSVWVGNEFDLAYSTTNAYGFYQLSGGSLVNSNWQQVARAGGIGVFYQFGGTNTELSASQGMLLGNGGGTGIVYVAGGVFNNLGRIGIGWSGAARAELTISNATVTVGNTGVQFNQTAGGTATAILNLNAGAILETKALFKQNSGGNSIVNFNGGTLRANTGNQTILGNGSAGVGAGALNGAYVYAGGVTFDTASLVVTNTQDLRAPTGNGVTGVVWNANLSGYIGAPFVSVDGDGSGATAVALFDPVSGTVTGILITCYGQNYTTAPTFTLTGGGGATTNLGAIGLLAPNTSGSLTKIGRGTLILNSYNDYAGGTDIREGYLRFDVASAVPAAGLVNIRSNAIAVFNFAGIQSILASNVDRTSSGGIALRDFHQSETINLNTAGLSNIYIGAIGNVALDSNFTPYGNVLRFGGGGGVLTYSNTIGASTTIDLASLPDGLVLVLAATNSNTGTIVVSTGNTLRANDGVGLSTNVNLILAGGVFETGADFTRSLGTAANQVRVNDGGFSAYGTPVNINLGGAGATQTWGSAYFAPTELILNGSAANTNLTFVNPIDLNGGTRAISVNATGAPATLAGAIFGTGNLVKNGVGTLILGAASTYTGGTIINNGTLQLSGNNMLPTTTAVILSNSLTAALSLNNYNQTIASLSGGGIVALGSGTLTVGDANSTTFSGVITGNGGLIKTGSGTLTFYNTTHTYTGLTLVTQGTLGLDSAEIKGPVTLTNGTRLVVTGAGRPGLLGEFYNVTPVSNNFATLDLLLAHLSAYTPDYTAPSTVVGVNFDFGRNDVTPPGAFTNTPYASVGGTRTTNFEVKWTGKFVAPTNGVYYFDTASDDGSMLWIDGTNVVYNNYWQGVTTRGGSITLTAGVHEVVIAFYQGSGGYGMWADVALPGGTTNRLPNTMLLYGSPQIGSLNGDAASLITLSNTTLSIVQSVDGAFYGTITGGVSDSIIKTGSAVLALFGTNTYGGGTTINGGVLRANYGSGLPTTGNVILSGGVLETMGTLNNVLGTGSNQIRIPGGDSGFSAWGAPLTVNLGGSGATLVWGSADFNPSTLILNAASANNNLTFANSLDLGGTNRTIAVNSSVATMNGQILGTGNLIKTGVGTLVFGNTNTYTGATFINGGTLQMNAPNVMPANTALTITNRGFAAFDLNGFNQTIASLSGSGTVALGSATLTVGDANNTTFNGVITGSGGLVKTGSGTLTLPYQTHTYSGLTLISQGTLALESTRLTGAVTINNGATLTVTGLGLGLMGEYYNITPSSNNFATLELLNAHLSSYTPDYMALSTVNSNVFDMYRSGTSYTPPGAFTNTPYASVGGTRTTNFEVRWTGRFIAPTNGVYYFDTASDDGSMLWIDGTNVVYNNYFQGVTTRGGTINLTAGEHDIVIAFYQGGGDYGMWADVALPGGTTNRIPNSMLAYGYQPQIGSLSGAVGSTIALSNTTLTIVQTNDGVFAGNITGGASDSIVKQGSALLSLLGTNTYGGTTVINAGTLAINGRLENSAVTVNSGGVLAGNGFIAKSVTLRGGATLSPGNSVGTLTVGDLTLTNGVQLVFELGAPGASDLVIVTNALSFSGMETNWFVLSAVSGFGAGTYTLFDALNYGSSTLGSGTNFTNIAGTGLSGYLWLDSANQDVKLTVVPEPGTGTLVAVGLLGMWILLRRQRRI